MFMVVIFGILWSPLKNRIPKIWQLLISGPSFKILSKILSGTEYNGSHTGTCKNASSLMVSNYLTDAGPMT